MAGVVGVELEGATWETESLDGAGLDDDFAAEEEVVGRPAGPTTGGEGAGDFRDRKGEMVEEALWDLELLPNIGA